MMKVFSFNKYVFSSATVVVLMAVMSLAACRDKIVHPEDAARQAFSDAAAALERGDYEAYLSYVDYGAELDSAAAASMAEVVRRHEEWKRAEREDIVAVRVVDVSMESDSVCYIFYEHVFADSCRETASQKMVAKDGQWRLRVRT